MSKHPLTPDEYRAAEGVDPRVDPHKLFDPAEVTLGDVAAQADETLPDNPIPERMEAALDEANIVTDHLIEKLDDSVDEKVYVEWGLKAADIMALIKEHFRRHPDHPTTLELKQQFDAIRTAVRQHSEKHHDDPDYLDQETEQVLIAYDGFKKILAALENTFGVISKP